MSVYKKLQQARIRLQNTKLTKSGKNKFAGYEYFELTDFLPAIQNICAEVGLCGVVSFTREMAYLNICETEGEGCIVFSSPMSSAALKGCHEVQNLGAVQTYLRRYLWTAAFEIVEHDALDATVAEEPRKPAKVEAVKPLQETATVTPTETKSTKIFGQRGDWQIAIDEPPETGVNDWLAAVQQACKVALDFAQTEEDVLTIFKKNKVLFDKVKNLDAQFFKELMEDFSKTKSKFIEKEAA